MNMKQLGKITLLALALLIVETGCQKTPVPIKQDVLNAHSPYLHSTGASDPLYCSTISVVNYTNVYGYYNLDGNGNPIYTDFNEASLKLGFDYNIHDDLFNTDTFAPAVDPVTHASTAAPYWAHTLAHGEQMDMDLVYNTNWSLRTGNLTYYGPMTLQVLSNVNGAVAQDLTFNIVPSTSGEGTCGTMVLYWIENGDSTGLSHNSGLRTTGGSTGSGSHHVSTTVYNVRADVLSKMNLTEAQATGNKITEDKVIAETSRRIGALKKILNNALTSKLSVVKNYSKAEYDYQKSRPDTTKIEAAVKTSIAVQAKEADAYTPAFQDLMDKVSRHFR